MGEEWNAGIAWDRMEGNEKESRVEERKRMTIAWGRSAKKGEGGLRERG